jgi:hypothetical protein
MKALFLMFCIWLLVRTVSRAFRAQVAMSRAFIAYLRARDEYLIAVLEAQRREPPTPTPPPPREVAPPPKVKPTLRLVGGTAKAA